MSQLFRWRKHLCERIAPAAAMPARLVPEPRARQRRARGESRIEIELASGDRLRLEGEVDGRALPDAIANLRMR